MIERSGQIRENFEKAGFSITGEQEKQFISYYKLLVETNKVMNLTAITEWEEVIKKHFLDSAMVLQYMDLKKEKIIDVGTGAGFPGIPIKILCPSIKLVLLDSLKKRISFLRLVIDKLGLMDVETIHSRAEDAGRFPVLREQFDVSVSRAVANLSTLSEYCLPFVKTGGYFISYKSGKVEEEILSAKKAFSILCAVPEKVERFTVPGTDLERSLVFLLKKENLPKRYPRKAGLPGKNPCKVLIAIKNAQAYCFKNRYLSISLFTKLFFLENYSDIVLYDG